MSSNNANSELGRFVTVADLAAELNVSTKHIRRAIGRGELPVHRFGRVLRIAPGDRERYIRHHLVSGRLKSP